MRRQARFSANNLVLVALSKPVLHPPGSLVRLNSGGPVGVVRSLGEDDRCLVKWLGRDDDPQLLPDRCLSLA